MTCIIGLLEDGVCYIGSDTCGSNGYTYENCNHSKVFRNGEFIIGGTTSFRMLDLLEYTFEPPFIKPSDEKDMERYMRTSFVNAVRICLKTGGFSKVQDTCRESGGTFLIGYKDKMWRMQDDFSIITRTGYDSVGCGGEVAIGSLWTTRELHIGKGDPTQRILLALKAAESYLVGVRGPFNILSTKAE